MTTVAAKSNTWLRRQHLLHRPRLPDQTSSHRGGAADRPVHPADVERSEVDRQGGAQVFAAPAESVGQPGEAPELHPHVEVLPLDVCGAIRSSAGVP